MISFLSRVVRRQQPVVNAAAPARRDTRQPLEELLNKDVTPWNLSRHDGYQFMAAPMLGNQENNAVDIDGGGPTRGRGAAAAAGGQRAERAAINHSSLAVAPQMSKCRSLSPFSRSVCRLAGKVSPPEDGQVTH